MRSYEQLAVELGVEFKDLSLLELALVHRSFHNEYPLVSKGTNERLEFLGDSVLGFIVTEELYLRFPALSEGELTNLRSALVRTETLARFARDLSIGQWLALGKGEEAAGGRRRPQILAGALEAILGAIFLSAGIEAVRGFVLRLVGPDIAAKGDSGPIKDHKSRLQEFTQARWQQTPSYRTVASHGPEHAKEFEVEVGVGNRIAGTGRGRSKQVAEQAAAESALAILSAAPPESVVE